MVDIFQLFDWVGGLLIAIALAMMALSHREIRALRLFLVLGAMLTAVRWLMWGFYTDAPWTIRALAGAVIGSLLLGGLPAAWKFAKERELLGTNAPQAIDPAPSRGAASVMFTASENSNISAKDMQILSDIRGIGIASATKNSSITIDGMTVANSENLSFPAPSLGYSTKSNLELKIAAKTLAELLRIKTLQHQRSYDLLRSQGKNPSDFLKSEDDKFKSEFQPTALFLSGAILARIPSGHPPSFNLTPKYLEGVSPSVRRGMRVLLLNGLTPIEGDAVADFLENISDRLPP